MQATLMLLITLPTSPSPAEWTAARVSTNESIEIRCKNVSQNLIAVNRYRLLYIARLYDSQKNELTDWQGWRNRNEYVELKEFDWVVLYRGDSVSFQLNAYDIKGPIQTQSAFGWIEPNRQLQKNGGPKFIRPRQISSMIRVVQLDRSIPIGDGRDYLQERS